MVEISPLELENRRLRRRCEQLERQTAAFARMSAHHENISRLLNEQLEQSVEVLKNATNAKTDFLSRMSHEIRTPLNAVIGLTDLAQKTDDDVKIQDYLMKIRRSSRFLLGIVNDVLDFSKIEAGKLQLAPEDFEFKTLISETVDMIRFKAEEKHLRMSVVLDDAVPALLFCDHQRLQQVLTNLLSNAVKFTPEFGRIELAVKCVSKNKESATLQINVKDTGIGISEAQQKRLFVSFSQAEATTARTYGGTGLGLAISQNIVKLMGGEIKVRSKEDEGSDFFFEITLPLGNVSAITAAAEEAVPDLSGKHILLAEDNEINREIVEASLEVTGVSIDTAENGNEALKLFVNNPGKYDMIFMDIVMPEKDGFTTAREIRLLPNGKTVPIIAMTANVFKEDIDNCISAGMNDHIGKPIDFNIMFSKIRKYI
ncbi:MAG: response regulator [Ruminococcus sp.]|jgi:signal transduction histidine kinase/ActR/RegA family two-component response regulator|nr:response regulator [Ruminococcus sp.]